MKFDPFENIQLFSELSLFPERIDMDFDGTTDTHFTDPHWVNDFVKDDGTFVHGYWRDGDGDTSHDLFKSDGGGYYAHDSYHNHE